jgi:tyrocidine synthetase-3
LPSFTGKFIRLSNMYRLVNRTDKGQVPSAITDLISQHRDAHPHSIALTCGSQRVTYEKLDRAACRFAAYLVQLGIRPGGTVAICMERSFDWIVAAFGVMRAGAAYVPLDPAWPDSRVRFAVEDSGATILVARAPLLNRLQVTGTRSGPRT